jgi:hypothetical protein
LAKLTHTQSILLTTAVAREDGAAPIPTNMRKAVAAKAAASLVERKLMREVRTRKGMPIWRVDDAGRSVSLVITRAGRDAVGAKDGVKTAAEVVMKTANDSDAIATHNAKNTRAALRQSSRSVGPAVEASTHFEVDLGAASASAEPRSGTKLAQVIATVRESEGATLEALVSVTGWQPHTVRAALTRLRKRGFAIERARVDGKGSSVYRIVTIGNRAA